MRPETVKGEVKRVAYIYGKSRSANALHFVLLLACNCIEGPLETISRCYNLKRADPCILTRATRTQSCAETIQRGIFPPPCTCLPVCLISYCTLVNVCTVALRVHLTLQKVFTPKGKHGKDQTGLLLTYHVDTRHRVVHSLDLVQVKLFLLNYISVY